MNSKKRFKNQNQIEEETPSKEDEILKDLDSYLKLSNESINSKEKDGELIRSVRKEAVKKLIDLYDLKEEQNFEEIYKLCLEMTKARCLKEINYGLIKIKYDNQVKANQNNSSIIETQSSKIMSLEKYNKLLLDKCNELKEEKNNIANNEKDKRNELIKKCEEFMKDMEEKYKNDMVDKENLINENNELRNKLKESRIVLEERFEQVKHQQQFEETFVNNMQGKINDMIENEKLIKTENIQLKATLSLTEEKFKELTKVIQVYNKNIDLYKREMDKKNIENTLLTKQYADIVVEMSTKDKELSKLKMDLEKKEKDIMTLTSLSKKLEEKNNLLKSQNLNQIQLKKVEDTKTSECENTLEDK